MQRVTGISSFSIALALCSIVSGQEPRSDPFSFQHLGRDSLVRAGSGTPWGFMSANPAAILFNGQAFLYFRGIAGPGKPSTVSVWTAKQTGFDGITWNTSPTRNPILAPGRHDPDHVLDPCAVVFKNKVFLYYMAVVNHVSNVFLAVSDDGLRFTKLGQVLSGCGTPCPVVNPADGRLYLFFTKRSTVSKGWEYHVIPSSDGVRFNHSLERTALQPTGIKDAFDAQSISTARITREGDYFYLTYGGCPSSEDYPEAIGIARSKDLYTWERYPVPICLRGPTGSWNEGALWSGALLNVNGVYYLWYEACGSGAKAGSAASNEARNTSYGGYGSRSKSYVGLAVYRGSSKTLADWTAEFGPALYTLKNANSNLFLEVAGQRTEDGASVVQYSWWAGDNQKWRIERLNGFYKITNVKSGKVLETAGGSQLNGGKSAQWTWGNTRNQHWHIVPLGNGRYHIINRWSGMSLEVAGESTVRSAQVDQWTWWGGNNQQWEIAKLP